jgi:hypothetical protein
MDELWEKGVVAVGDARKREVERRNGEITSEVKVQT